jgi:AcrR family transcriptional regulator
MTARNTAQRLADAALAILRSEGAEAISMRRVAADAGVTAMATYRHYPNREALLRKVVDDAVAETTSTWSTNTTGDLANWTDRLLNQFLDFALHDPNVFLFLVSARWTGARKFPEDFQEGGSPLFAPMLFAITGAIEAGILKPDDPLEVTLAITMPVMGLVQQYLSGRMTLPEKAFRELCERTTRRVLHGIEA